jgi:hypothetical protein
MKILNRSAALILAGCLLVPAAALAMASTTDAHGVARLPPNGGDYVSPSDIHAWLKDHRGEVTAELRARHAGFQLLMVKPGGILNGEIENFTSTLTFTITGQGPLAGWSRTLVVPANCETHIGPRTAGEPVQSFDTNMYRIQGAIKGDPDFEYFEVVAGTGNGLDSPGHTTTYLQKDGSWLVDSTFQVNYQIKYKGAAGGKLDGVEDVAEGVITMTAVPTGADAGTTTKTATAK